MNNKTKPTVLTDEPGAKLQILQAMPNLSIFAGVGDYANQAACVMSATVAEYRLRRGEPLGIATDELDCVCPVIRELVVHRNDTSGYINDEERKTWAFQMVPRLLDSHKARAITQSRVEAAIRYATQVVAPAALDRTGLHDEAKTLRQLTTHVSMWNIALTMRAIHLAAAGHRATPAESNYADAVYYVIDALVDAANYAKVGSYVSAAGSVGTAVDELGIAFASERFFHFDTMIDIAFECNTPVKVLETHSDYLAELSELCPVLGYDGKVIRMGDRIELHPGTDLWMRGARFGIVVGVRPTLKDQLRIKLDNLPGTRFSCSSDTIRRVPEPLNPSEARSYVTDAHSTGASLRETS